MKRVAIVHFMPLEFYPPVTNALNFIGIHKQFTTKVWSTINNKGRVPYSNSDLKRIRRTHFPKTNDFIVYRLFKYFYFNILTFFELIIFNPSVVIYYESYSAWPVYWYIKWFGKQKKIFKHCHEYFDAKWYAEGMTLVKLYHSYEKRFLYPRADWISHTNIYRVDMFLKDFPELEPAKIHILPNYPPKSWSLNDAKETGVAKILRAVYVGSLSLEHTYIKEFCDWVVLQDGKIHFDIFAFNCPVTTVTYLKQLNSDFINFYDDGIAYNDIPNTLKSHDIGVILYKGTSLNAKYCASNKLFEYLICNLEVWLSEEQLGSVPYLRDRFKPRVLALNFKELHLDLITDYKSANQLPLVPLMLTCENELQKLIEALQN